MRNNKDPMDGFFKIFPYIFIVMFTIVGIFLIVQFATFGFIAYKAISDPHGTSNFIGTVAGEVIRPIANAIEGE